MLRSSGLVMGLSFRNFHLPIKVANQGVLIARIASNQSLAQSGLLRLRHGCRYFCVSSNNGLLDQKKETVMVRMFDPDKSLPHQQWTIRMNNQNGYLSWCRNSYLCLSIAIAISMAPVFLAHYGSSDPNGVGDELSYVLCGAGALAVGNMVFGSCEFLYQLFKTRSITQISPITALIYAAFVLIHAILFCDFARCLIRCFEFEDKS